jgi:hypothetical protein
LSTVYLETSAPLSWLLTEPRGDSVRVAVDAAATVVTTLEAERALVRAESSGLLREGDAQRLRGLFRRIREPWIAMRIEGDVLTRAARPFPVEPVRTLDALHLATALAFAEAFSDLRVVTLDKRIADNAVALGIA